ncbi:hypothetical protein HGRIS_002144 [Hohenbuehelia grisea]|uniref:Uncharacterized protein n=1 Tax=Hohenbuehelia grisea TaxID=104357 RepID=A0ABR3JJU0_9AGAR
MAPTPISTTPSAAVGSSENDAGYNSKTVGIAVGASLGGSVFLILVAILGLLLYKKRKNSKSDLEKAPVNETPSFLTQLRTRLSTRRKQAVNSMFDVISHPMHQSISTRDWQTISSTPPTPNTRVSRHTFYPSPNRI